MALVTVKLFGVLRIDSHIAEEEMAADTLQDVFDQLSRAAGDGGSGQHNAISFREAVVYIDGKRTTKKHRKLKSGEVIWLMSPASGG